MRLFIVHKYFVRAQKKYEANREIILDRLPSLREKNYRGIKCAGAGEHELLEELYDEIKEDYIEFLHDTVRNEEFMASAYAKVLSHRKAWEVGLFPSTRATMWEIGKLHGLQAQAAAKELNIVEGIEDQFGNVLRAFTEINANIYRRAEPLANATFSH